MDEIDFISFDQADPNFQHHLLGFDVPNVVVPDNNTVHMAAPNVTMPPPMSSLNANMTHEVQMSGTTVRPQHEAHGRLSSEGVSCNDSGYFSPFQMSAHSSRSLGSNAGKLGMSNYSPSKLQNPSVGGQNTGRGSWQEDLANIGDEWDNNFINNFEEDLFGFDPADLTSMVDGLLGSPSRSPLSSSPFKSPRQTRSSAAVHGLSPFSTPSSSNVLLTGTRKSPRHSGGSPFRIMFSTPSPVKGQNPYTRNSPMTRQRRRILQSPENKPDNLPNFLDLPGFMDLKETDQPDNLGMMPFQRTNSLGFTPTEEISTSCSLSSLYENAVPSTQLLPEQNSSTQIQGFPLTTSLNFQESENLTQLRLVKRVKAESPYNLRSSPIKKNELSTFKQQSPARRKSPARFLQGRISVTRHSHTMTNLSSKEMLRLVRARFKEVLNKTAEDAVIKVKRSQSTKVKTKDQKEKDYPEISQALSQSVPSTSSSIPTAIHMENYVPVQTQRPAGKRRQEILPKPTTNWPMKQPCKIAPKKRKR